MSERFEELAPFPDHSHELAGLVGKATGEPQLSPHAVNAPMIRHWVEATGRQAQINTFGGGVNEVQREIVATAGLGMTRGAR